MLKLTEKRVAQLLDRITDEVLVLAQIHIAVVRIAGHITIEINGDIKSDNGMPLTGVFVQCGLEDKFPAIIR